MRFYNRENELDKLKKIQEYSLKSAQFTILVGMRRVGKTMLIQEFFKHQKYPTLYFFVARKEESLLVEDYLNEIKEKLSIFIPGGICTFRDVFELLLHTSKTIPFTLMIDEFQDFKRINSSVYSSIQNLWDQYKHSSNMNLIVAGSIYSNMQKLFTDDKEPLFGRADYQIHLKPFKPTVLKEILNSEVSEWSNDDLLALYCTTGGIARYVEFIMKEQTEHVFNRRQMYETIISESSFFIEEGNHLLISEFGRKYDIYYSILSCIAAGKNSQAEIEHTLSGISIGMYLKKLIEEYEIIERILPIRSKRGTKKVKYQIKNIFLRFWFRYFDKYRSLIEIGNYEKLREIVISDYETYSGKILESYFCSSLSDTNQYTDIGSWWNEKDGTDEIDIVAINSLEKHVLIAEVKRNEKRYEHSKFLLKVNQLVQKEFKDYSVETKLFTLKDM